MSQSSPYKDGEIVWVKWGSVWWPGEVWSESKVPADIINNLRKPVIAFVKFLHEESFEYVRSLNNISKYNCEKKMENIKKGMDKYRTKNKMMINFPADVVKAEQLTHGNVNILSTLETPTKSRASTSSSSTPATTPTIATKTPETARKSTISVATPSSVSPVVNTKKTAGSYNSSVKVQNTTSSTPKANDKKLTCTMCNFATDRMNLLMFHIKNHSLAIQSRVNSPSSSSEIRKPIIPKSASKKSDYDDGIAEDVRKIKESMKETIEMPVLVSSKKTRTPAAKSTPKAKSRATKREKKIEKEEIKIKEVVVDEDEKIETVAEEKSKINTNELKNELLADWMDDDELGVDKDKSVEEKVKLPTIMSKSASPEKISAPPELPPQLQQKPEEKSEKSSSNEVSRSIRNIPKKQRVSEMYIIQPEPEKEKEKVEIPIIPIESSSSATAAVVKKPPQSFEHDIILSSSLETPTMKKSQKSTKRKHTVTDTDIVNEPEKKKMSEDNDEKLLVATNELLNETEVPKASNNVQSPSTFHKSNDIDKRYLPPKERNKRIFRARNSPEMMTTTTTTTITTTTMTTVAQQQQQQQQQQQDKNIIVVDENESKPAIPAVAEITEDNKIQTSVAAAVVTAPIVSMNDRQEVMLPHKKKQSSRLLTTEKQISPVREVHNNRDVKQEQTTTTTVTNSRIKRSRKSSENSSSNEVVVVEKVKAVTVEETTTAAVAIEESIITQSPLREVIDESLTPIVRKSPSPIITECVNRIQKRPRSKDDSLSGDDQLITKKFHKSDSPQPRTITIACSSETICITSKGTLSVARRDSLKTTNANNVVVTSQVIISEATKLPVVSSQVYSTTDTTKQSMSTIITLPQQALKNALKIPKENMEDLKKQGLVTIENNRTKLTPKGRQKFKEFQNELSLTPTSSSSSSSLKSNISSTSIDVECEENDRTKTDSPKLEAQQQKTNETATTTTTTTAIADDDDDDDDENVVMEDVSQKTDDGENLESNETADKQIQQQQQQQEEKENDEKNEDKNKTIQNKEDDDDENVKEVDIKSDEDCSKSIKDKDSDEFVPDKKQDESTNEDKNVSLVDDDDDEVSLKKKDDEKEVATTTTPTENGNKEKENEIEKIEADVDAEVPSEEDANANNGGGLIALQAENFGGPPNCFYLCRQVEDRYEPVDNQILVLNAQNALVPYEGEILSPAETVQENLSAYSQLSPNSNIIINTPNGQKIELSHCAILALQEQADENGIASLDLSGEQLELNINAILEAIAAQQDMNESGETLIPSAMLIDSTDGQLIIDSTDIPVDLHHTPSVATQVSETLSKPIMSTTVAPEIAINPAKSTIAEHVSKNLNIEDSLATIGVTTQQRTSNVPKSLELPITVTNPTIAETVNHRKLATSVIGAEVIATESFVVVQSADGSDG